MVHEEYFEGRGMYAWNKHSWIPFCMVDRVIIPPVDKSITEGTKRRSTTPSYKQIIRWLLARSTSSNYRSGHADRQETQPFRFHLLPFPQLIAAYYLCLDHRHRCVRKMSILPSLLLRSAILGGLIQLHNAE